VVLDELPELALALRDARCLIVVAWFA